MSSLVLNMNGTCQMEKGTKSNITGNQLEVAVKTVLTGKGFELVNYRAWEKIKRSMAKNYYLRMLLLKRYTSTRKHGVLTPFKKI
jgi:hypothetical protein